MTTSAHVLVIDDDPTLRLKLAAAVKALGHSADAAGSGEDALGMLAAAPYDLILLDLMMPGMDGYAVLTALGSDAVLRDIPVLVISGVEDSRDVARAIELGADDVLPKSFDPVLFRTRIDASLRRWRLRQAESAYLGEVERLSAAARIVEKTNFNPSKLGLEGLLDRKDDLAAFARVFLQMADRIYIREITLRRRIGLLMGGLLLLLFGAVKGAQPALSRMLGQSGLDPLGLAAWSLASGAGISLVACLVIGQMPRLSRDTLPRLALFAIVSCALPQVLLLAGASTVSAIVISLLLATESLIVFALAGILGHEMPSARRLFGIALGLAGVVAILASGQTAATTLSAVGVILILLVTLGYGIGKIVLSSQDTATRNAPVAQVATVMVIAALAVFPVALLSGAAVPIGALWNASGLVVVALGAISAICNIVLLVVVRMTGAVFASQTAYAATGAGVIWSMLLLGERMTLWTGGALALLFLGLILVMPRDREEDLDTIFARDPELDAARARLGI